MRGNFSESSEIRTFFRPKTGGLQKKKVFTEIETDFSAKIGNSNAFSGRITTCTSQLRHPISFGGSCFQFFTKNRPQKHQRRAILHTSRAPPPPPPGYATALKPQVLENCPVLGSRTALFFERLKFRWKTSETSRKICGHLFCFPQLEHRRRQGVGGQAPPIEISPMTKKPIVSSVSVFFSIFR